MTRTKVNSLLESSVRKTEGQAALSSSGLLGRCATCAHWQPSPSFVPGCAPEKICGATRNMGFGMYGQDGKSVITCADFGCIHHRPNGESSDGGK